jgi:hypothetical protein
VIYTHIPITIVVPCIVCDICQRASYNAAEFGQAGNQQLKKFPEVLRLRPDQDERLHHGPLSAATYHVQDAPTEEQLKERAVKDGWIKTGQTDPNNPAAILIGYMICPQCAPIVMVVRNAMLVAAQINR